jgi:hypothetical protein
VPNEYDLSPVYLQSGDPENENTPTLYAVGTLGARFTVRRPTRGATGAVSGRFKTYQLVKTDSTMTTAPFPGAVAWWSDKTQYLVTTKVTTLGRGRIAGIFNNFVTLGNFCCIQKTGPANVKLIDAVTASPSTAGLFVIPSATDGKADTIAAGGNLIYPSLGVTAGTLNLSDNTCVVDLDVPETV